MKYLVTLVLVGIFSAPLHAQTCDQRLMVAVPEPIFSATDYRKMRNAIMQAEDGMVANCLEFAQVGQWPDEVHARTETGEFDAALVPLSSLAAEDSDFLPLVQGYRFTDAKKLQAEFGVVAANQRNGKSVKVLGLATGEPAFPSFRAGTFNTGPEFSSDYEIVWEPGANREIDADAILSTPANFNAYVLIANPDAVENLSATNRETIQVLAEQIAMSTAVHSEEDAKSFLNEAQNRGMRVFDLQESDRQTLLRDIGTIIAAGGTTPIRWIQQCTPGTCGCSGTNVCSNQCCANQ